MRDAFFADLIASHDGGHPRGIASICSAHPLVLETTLQRGAKLPAHVLIEATCNQVNQDGGYTGMTPAHFRAHVLDLADRTGFSRDRLILGGDHLGPNPWRHLPAAAAMAKAEAMVAAYAEAGFTKIHLDASMSCADDPLALPVETIATRAAALAAVAERHSGAKARCYIIGTEVPVPGGATEHVEAIEITKPPDAAETVEAHRRAFDAAGIAQAFDGVAGLVVQPGVEFGHDNVVVYDPAASKDLSSARRDLGLVYEAHSTDYQSTEALTSLVRDGFAILKVGPWLTFALREALYGLDRIAEEMFGEATLRTGMEALMLREPQHWQRYYHGSQTEQSLHRHFSYSDRIRYYWASADAQRLVKQLIERFAGQPLPETLISQYLPAQWQLVVAGELAPHPEALVSAAVKRVLDIYGEATTGA